MNRYTPKLHPSGHVDMVPDEDGAYVRFDDHESEMRTRQKWLEAKARGLGILPWELGAQPHHWDEPTRPDRWDEGTLLRAQEGEE